MCVQNMDIDENLAQFIGKYFITDKKLRILKCNFTKCGVEALFSGLGDIKVIDCLIFKCLKHIVVHIIRFLSTSQQNLISTILTRHKYVNVLSTKM